MNFSRGIAALSGLFLTGVAMAAPVPYIGVQIQVTNPTNLTNGSPTSTALSPGQTAGVVPQANYNVVNAGADGGGAHTLTSGALNNASGLATAVTFSGTASDAWVTPTDQTTPNGALLSGETKASTNNTSTYSFSNVPGGTYNMLLYVENDTAGITSTYSVGTSSQTVLEQMTGGTPAFALATSSVAGNYVEFDNIVLPALGTITFTSTPVSGGNTDAGINAIQLLSVPEPASIGILGFGALGCCHAVVAGIDRGHRYTDASVLSP